MASINKVIFIGRMGADPEVKLAGSTKVARLRVATTEKWKTQDGEEKEKTDWHTIVAWRKLAEIAEKYIRKGTQVYVEGSLHYSEYTKDGEKRFSPEITADVLWGLDSKKDWSQAPTPPNFM